MSMNEEILNVLGNKMDMCSCEPMTGWLRDGYCNTDINDHGIHTVCCIVDDNFLEYIKTQGNDLVTPAPQFGFPGLKAGDHWCLCAGSWYQAYRAGRGCPINLEATHMETLAIIPIEVLKSMEFKRNLQ